LDVTAHSKQRGGEKSYQRAGYLDRSFPTHPHIGRFGPLCDFDWSWPKLYDHAVIRALMTLEFLTDATNVVLDGPNGLGKTTITRLSSAGDKRVWTKPLRGSRVTRATIL
jgi:hypothetical protein